MSEGEGRSVATEEVPIGAAMLLADAMLPARAGTFRIAVYRIDDAAGEIVALIHEEEESPAIPLVRLHSECLTGDVFGSLRCDCGEQLDVALAQIAEAPRGILLYLRQEGRGIGLVNKILAYSLQDGGLDTVDANTALGLPVDGRDYGAAAAVLRSLGISEVRLLTNNPAKSLALQQHGVQVIEQVPLQVPSNPVNVGYLRTKATRMGHLLTLPSLDEQAEPEA